MNSLKRPAVTWAKLSDEMRFFGRHFVIASSLSPTIPGADWDFRVNRLFYQSSSAAPQLSRCFGCPKSIKKKLPAQKVPGSLPNHFAGSNTIRNQRFRLVQSAKAL